MLKGHPVLIKDFPSFYFFLLVIPLNISCLFFFLQEVLTDVGQFMRLGLVVTRLGVRQSYRFLRKQVLIDSFDKSQFRFSARLHTIQLKALVTTPVLFIVLRHLY